MNLQEFIKEYDGHGVDFDGAYGVQCTDIIKQYMKDVLQVPVTGGHAKNMLGNLNKNLFEIIPAGRGEIPKAGDIIAWSWGRKNKKPA